MIVGIDLGTTNSLCAVFKDGQPQLIPNVHGEVLTPSVVGVLDDGQILVGAAARELRVTRPQQCAACFKRLMGSDRTLNLGRRAFTAPELSSLVLKSLQEDARQYLGGPVDEAVITVPAYFNDHQRKATKLAGELAGWRVRRIINEPTAAALTYGFHDRRAEKYLLVIDLGGGTFDVTLMEIFEGTLEIIATAGESLLGGEDFTDRLVAAALKHCGLHLEVAELKQPLRVARLRQECEIAKRALFQRPDARVRLPNEQGQFEDKLPTFKITAESFAALTQALVQRLAAPIGKALRDGGRAPEDISEVLLVGGATRMAVVRDFVGNYFHTEPQMRFNPDEVVALGAAVQAGLIVDDRAVDDMVMTDVCPFTLGVEVVKEFGRQRVDGYFTPVLHRNTTIPVSREEVFSTIHENQAEVVIRVFQGESRKVKDNLELGELRVVGIPPGPAGTPIHIRFTYDLNGILEVEAYVPDSGKKFATVLTQNARTLDPQQVEAAIKRLQELKFYPRDDLNNRRLVLFSERIVAEINPLERERLEEAIDQFERAMSAGDRELFLSVREGLLITLSQLGFEYHEHGTESSDDP